MKKKFEFSKLIIVIESGLVLLTSVVVLGLSYFCIREQYMGSLAFLTTMITAVWAAYGTSVSFYYRKAEKENIPKIQASMEIEKAQKLKEISTALGDADTEVSLK